MGMAKRTFLAGRGVEAIDHLDAGEDFQAFGALGQGNVGDAQTIDGADEQPGAAGRRLRLSELVGASQRDQGSLRGLDLYWLEEPGQWSAPLELPATNRSRRHDTLMPVVDARLLGPERGRARTAQEHTCHHAGKPHRKMRSHRCRPAEFGDHSHELSGLDKTRDSSWKWDVRMFVVILARILKGTVPFSPPASQTKRDSPRVTFHLEKSLLSGFGLLGAGGLLRAMGPRPSTALGARPALVVRSTMRT